jgi:hypothetical protein
MLMKPIHLIIRDGRKIVAEEWENYTGFEFLASVVMNSTVFWDIMTCSPL